MNKKPALIFFGLTLVGCFISSVSTAKGQITIDASTQVGATVDTWGWDLKGGVGRMNSVSEATTYFGRTSANLLRISIEANAHREDGSINTDTSLGVDWAANYGTMLDSIRTARSINPNLEIFASVKLRGANTFPGWVTDPGTSGNIAGNDVERVNRVKYAKLMSDYVGFMANEGIKLDYVGPNNESTGALTVDRFDEVVQNFRINVAEAVTSGTLDAQYNDFSIVGGEAFFAKTSASFIQGLNNNGDLHTVDITGSHFYANALSSGGDVASSWDSMSVASGGKPMWFTEVHMNPYNTGIGETAEYNIRKMRGGMGTIFEANKRGVSGFSWWGGANNGTRISHLLKRELVNTTMGAIPVATTPIFDVTDQEDVLFQAYLNSDMLHLWLANPGMAIDDLTIDISNFFDQENGLVITQNMFWANGDIIGADGAYVGELDWSYNLDTQQFTISQLPANSIALLSFQAIPEPFSAGILGMLGCCCLMSRRRR